MNRSRRTAGTSLVEILVVIVVFLIGILAIVQIFPGGFRLLGLTRSQSQATGLARATIERLKSGAEQLPERIVPVRYGLVGGNLVAVTDSTRRSGDLGPTADSLDQNGNLFLAGDNIGGWRRASGANMVNRVIGEGAIVPAPRPVNSSISGDLYYGGLMTLQFGPAVFNNEIATGSNNDVVFNVYGNDLSLSLGVPPAPATDPFRMYLFYCTNPENNGATVHVPQTNSPIRYRLAATGYVRDAMNNVRSVEVVDYIITAPASGSYGYMAVPMSAVFVPPLINAGETLIGVEVDSLQLAPLFTRINKADSFVGVQNPYEYKLIDDVNPGVSNANMGVLLFSPAGYNYYVPNAQGRRMPLAARVNYNVYDWGILRDEFRIPTGDTAQPSDAAVEGPARRSQAFKLTLNSLKVKGNSDTDGRTYNGLGFVVPNGGGGTQELDVVVQDTETGGIYAYNPANLRDPIATAYRVDRSSGTIWFQDRNSATPELEVTLYNPVDWTPISIPDARGRSVRVMYQTAQEFQAQVMKAADRYVGVSGVPGVGQCALGALGDPAQQTKLYFSNSDLGRNVAINEAFVQFASGIRKVSVSGIVKAPTALDPVQLPSFDLRDIYGADVVAWSPVDETGKSQGYIIRGVRGASVAVRVLWNPQKFTLGTNGAANMDSLDRWGQGWRKSVTETYLQKGGTQ